MSEEETAQTVKTSSISCQFLLRQLICNGVLVQERSNHLTVGSGRARQPQYIHILPTHSTCEGSISPVTALEAPFKPNREPNARGEPSMPQC